MISIHALLAESDAGLPLAHPAGEISIHALLAESDISQRTREALARKFQSTLSLRRATPHRRGVCVPGSISIHALLAESDTLVSAASSRPSNFNPRSPCGERRYPPTLALFPSIFQSTLSLRRATDTCKVLTTRQIHFNPRSPCGERHEYLQIIRSLGEFQSTLSLRRATGT